jgi:hypothetical protein
MPLSVLSGVYTGNDQSGSGTFFGVGRTPRYNRIPSTTLTDMGFRRNLSSATVYSSSTADATLILFGSPVSFVSFPDYQGLFMQITNRRSSGSEHDVDRFSDHGFNNLAENVLVVAPNRGTEFRFSFRDLFLDRWNDVLSSQLADPAHADGGPTLTWEMWPTGISHLDSDRMYLKVHQNLDIRLHCWPDYDASMTYHIYLYLDGGGRLRGHVARWAYWIEGGAKADDIEDQLRPAVIDGATTLTDELGNQLDALSGFSFTDLFYLPGSQTSRPPTGVVTGSTFDDVTIVVAL